MVAFVATNLVLILALAPLPWFAKRRPPGTPLSWGEALLAGTFAFFLFWWAYGVIPHYWLTWADNELGWRADKLVFGPFDLLKPQVNGGWFPMTVSYQAIRDILAVLIYAVFLVLPILVWGYWQNRGDRVEAEIPTTNYGRPLVKKGV